MGIKNQFQIVQSIGMPPSLSISLIDAQVCDVDRMEELNCETSAASGLYTERQRFAGWAGGGLTHTRVGLSDWLSLTGYMGAGIKKP